MKKKILYLLILFFAVGIQAQVPDVEQLRESDGNQSRDLSIPGSRLVLNPFFFNSSPSTTPSEYSNHPSLPLNVGYLSTERISERRMEKLLSLYRDNGAGGCEEAASYSTEWLPNELPFKATYSDGTTLSGTDFLYDKHTVVRQIEFSPATDKSTFVLAGFYDSKNVTISDNILKVNNGTFSYAIRSDVFSRSDIRFYKSIADLKAGKNASVTPGYGPYWAVKFTAGDLSSNRLNTVVAFSYRNDKEVSSALNNRVKNPFEGNNMQLKYTECKDFWNDFLRKVPCPSNFSVETVDNYGVTPEQVRRDYYNAWVFVAQSVLGADPQRFPYPQVVTGKGSMWDESDDRAPYSATWESFFGIQFYAFIDPETAWGAFEGIMSLTDADGVIGGESLPSRKAQTAWVLYQITQDKERLEKVYASLERYLNWRLIYPHWIHKSLPDKNKKDAEFAFSAIVDMDFMVKISRVIRDEQTANAWKEKQTDFYNQCLTWFWSNPKSFPYQYYDVSTQGRSGGNPYWVTSGLHMDMLSGEYLESTYSLFNYNFRAKNNFGGSGLGLPKYPDVSYTLYGLLEHQKTSKAENVIDVCIRDVVRSCWFSEQYETSGTPFPTGVRPSLFGASMMIDFVMIKNGFRYDMGIPLVQNIFKKAASISGIRYGNDILNIECDSEGNYKVSGSYPENAGSVPTQYGGSVPVSKGGASGLIETVEQREQVLKVSGNCTSSPSICVNIPQNTVYSLCLYDFRGCLQATLAHQTKTTGREEIYCLNGISSQSGFVCLYLPGKVYSGKIIITK